MDWLASDERKSVISDHAEPTRVIKPFLMTVLMLLSARRRVKITVLMEAPVPRKCNLLMKIEAAWI